MKSVNTALFCILGTLTGSAYAANSPAFRETYAQAVDDAVAQGAAHDTQWLRLGHYKPRGPIRRLFRSEYRSEADSDTFFISADGKNDPAAELRATLIAFAAPPPTSTATESEHAQCQFPARRKWAFKKLNWEKVLRDNGLPVLDCEQRRAWKKQLDAEGVSLVFASAYLGNAASMFGHTFLKFHSRSNRHGKDLLDYGVNFAAETGGDGGVPYALYGLFGFYPGRFTMQPFHQTLRTYANLEGRDLIEYRIRFSPEELDFFIDHLFELERTHFDYYFLTENCSYFLLTALETAKPDISLSDEFWYEVIPADSVRVVARTPNLVDSTKFRPSLFTMLRAQADRLSNHDLRFARDIVQNQTPSTFAPDSLKSVSTPALDLALDYGAVRATDDPSFDKLNHKLRSERAKRGGISLPVAIATPRRPEEGHDPGRIGVIFEQPINHDGAQSRMGLQFRFAYHDRLSNDDGYLPGTTLEVFRTTLMTNDWINPWSGDRHPSRMRVTDMAVFEILSAQPLSAFSQPLTWRAAFGLREPFYTKSLGPFLNGGAGSTIEFSKYLWVSALIDGEVLGNPDLPNGAAVYLGPRIVATAFLVHAIPNLKFGVDWSLMRALTPARHFDRLTAELAWAPLRNLELRLNYTDSGLETGRRSEWGVKLYQHLLF